MFNSTHDALVFAYNFKGAPARVIFETPPQGAGLGGLDGAAQAGMIRAAVKTLGRIEEAAIIANYAPRRKLCPFCRNGRTRAEEWWTAVNEIASTITGTKSHAQNMKMALKYFGEKFSRVAIAEGQNQQEALKIFSVFKKGMKETEARALARIDDLLRERGIVGETD